MAGMTGPRFFRSSALAPHARGVEFGQAHARQIQTAIEGYRTMWRDLDPGHDALADGQAALDATLAFAPHLHQEMLGLAEGAGIDPRLIGAINARTEILARLRAAARPKARARGECSVVIALPGRGTVPPVAVQTWDWYHRFRDSWLVWEIPLEDGTTTRTMTEYGIVGKAGLNSRGIGLLFTILHHQDDGQRIGTPVHVVARAALDLGTDISRAAQIAAGADVSASSSLNLSAWDGKRAAAITVEVNPGGPGLVLPEANGLLVHTNHFLDPKAAQKDTAPAEEPDTLLRRDMALRHLGGADCTPAQAVEALNSHLLGEAGICCHPGPGNPDDQYATLATLVLDLEQGHLTAHDGGPCSFSHS